MAGVLFPVGFLSLRLLTMCVLSAKPGLLAACIAPHPYLSGAAISPPVCIRRTLRPNGSSPACTGDGDFLSLHHCASWRTDPAIPLHVIRPSALLLPQLASVARPTPAPANPSGDSAHRFLLSAVHGYASNDAQSYPIIGQLTCQRWRARAHCSFHHRQSRTAVCN